MDWVLLVTAVLAGMLTVLAPCIFGALPIMLARSVDGFGRARRVIIGLLVSIFIFTLLLRVSTALLGVPSSAWQLISGLIIVLVGLATIWPNAYARLAATIGLEGWAGRSQQAARAQGGTWSDYLVGASLGPVFSACSPTYALIVAVILPTSPLEGIVYLLAFLAGLGAILAGIAVGGQRLVARLGWSLDPTGWFKRTLGAFLIVLGLMIAFGWDRDLLGNLVEGGWYDWQLRLEEELVN